MAEFTDMILRHVDRAIPTLGDTWYVVLPGERSITEATIVKRTESTVVLEWEDLACFSPITCQRRYAFRDVRFIEKIVDATPL